MQITKASLPEVLVLVPRRFEDDRGHFCETWNTKVFSESVGCDVGFVQDNESLSEHAGTIRGLHFQAPPHAQGKLVRCVKGEIFDVAVDFRVGSPTFGQWVAERLSAENGRQLWVPEGFLHGFMTLTPNALVSYKCTALYNSQADGAVRWDSAGIDWPHHDKIVMSEKDAAAPGMAESESPFVFSGGS